MVNTRRDEKLYLIYKNKERLKKLNINASRVVSRLLNSLSDEQLLFLSSKNKPKVLDIKKIATAHSIMSLTERTNKYTYKQAHRFIKENKIPLSKILDVIKLKNSSCIKCGWDKDVLDLHHVVDKRFGGSSNDFDNIVQLCPNCHRCTHTNKEYLEVCL